LAPEAPPLGDRGEACACRDGRSVANPGLVLLEVAEVDDEDAFVFEEFGNKEARVLGVRSEKLWNRGLGVAGELDNGDEVEAEPEVLLVGTTLELLEEEREEVEEDEADPKPQLALNRLRDLPFDEGDENEDEGLRRTLRLVLLLWSMTSRISLSLSFSLAFSFRLSFLLLLS
jgi:hypothetical protein